MKNLLLTTIVGLFSDVNFSRKFSIDGNPKQLLC